MPHIPVMLEQSLQVFDGQKLSCFVDATVGAGGFAKALLKAHPEIETYYACDRDESALEIARENLKEFEGKVEFVHTNFSDLREVLEEKGVTQVDGFFLIWECRQCN